MTIALTCPGCGKAYRVADQLAGREGKCRDCGSTFTIPRPEPIPPPAPDPGYEVVDHPVPAPPRGRLHSADRELDGEPRWHRRRRVRSWSLIVGAALVVGLLVGGGLAYRVGYLPFFGKVTLEKDLRYIPDNCQLLVYINMDRTLASAGFGKVKTALADAGIDIDKMIRDLDQNASLDEISRMVVGCNLDDPSNSTAVVVTCNKPQGLEEMKKSFAGKRVTIGPTGDRREEADTDFKEEDVGGYRLYEAKDGRGAFCLVNSHTVVSGPMPSLRNIMLRGKPAKLSTSMKRALEEVKLSRTCLAVMVDDSGKKAVSKNGPLQGPATPVAKKLDEAVEAIAFQLDLTDSAELTLTLLLRDGSQTDALQKDLKQTLDGVCIRCKNALGTGHVASRLLDSIEFDGKGARLTMSVTVDMDTLINSYKSMGKIMEAMRGMQGGPGPPPMPPNRLKPRRPR